MRILHRFGADVTVIDLLFGEKREFCDSDIFGKSLVLACTDNSELNAHITKLCKEKNIFVSRVDSAENSTFFFPALCGSEDYNCYSYKCSRSCTCIPIYTILRNVLPLLYSFIHRICKFKVINGLNN
ncbi:MAG: NAD(P)-dependent oxidoreductase [Firmicutes bacterium]|nr:NAD(P)-dependent oxidoreductase [Bacillota bacterium]